MPKLIIYNHSKYWLSGIGLGLVALHLLSSELFSHAGSFSHNALFWLVLIGLLWEQRDKLYLESDFLASFLGLSLLSFVLYRYWHLFADDFFLRLAPLLSLLGWGLLASGIRGLKQYTKELFLLLFLAIPWEFINLFDISQLTAKFSTFILWIMGFEVMRQGVWIIMPQGSVEVYSGCSGVKAILQLVGLCWILLTLIPTNWHQKIWLFLSAILLGFTINGIRVALMTILVALSNTAGFEYWHTGTGSLIFSAISVALLIIIVWLILQPQKLQF